MNPFNKRKQLKKTAQNTNPQFFIIAFQKRLGRTPNEYINEKLKTGSNFDAIKYLFNIVAAEISNQNNCKFFDFDYFYKPDISNKLQSNANPSQKVKRPEKAGKAWSREEELQLIKMYNSGVPNKEMCDKFKRTETGLAARLVKLGVITKREEFRNRNI